MLNIASTETNCGRIDLAATILAEKSGEVLLDCKLILSNSHSLTIEIIEDVNTVDVDLSISTVESARTLLSSSTLWPKISHFKIDWIIVNDTGSGRVKIWPL
ncbi:MAG: hypothetical protein OCC49_10525 [Fibrobacterales bacterium]